MPSVLFSSFLPHFHFHFYPFIRLLLQLIKKTGKEIFLELQGFGLLEVTSESKKPRQIAVVIHYCDLFPFFFDSDVSNYLRDLSYSKHGVSFKLPI